MHDHEQCRQLFAKLSEYIDEELEPSLCQQVEHHLRQCEPCQACLRSLQQTVALCREMRSANMPEDSARRLRQLVAQYTRQFDNRRPF